MEDAQVTDPVDVSLDGAGGLLLQGEIIDEPPA